MEVGVLFTFVWKQVSYFLSIPRLGLGEVLLVEGWGGGSFGVVLFGVFTLGKPFFSDLIREQVWFDKNLSWASLTRSSAAAVNCHNIQLRHLHWTLILVLRDPLLRWCISRKSDRGAAFLISQRSFCNRALRWCCLHSCCGNFHLCFSIPPYMGLVFLSKDINKLRPPQPKSIYFIWK